MGFESYKGSINLGAGLTPASEGFPLMQSCDIQIDESGKRLDKFIEEQKNEAGENDKYVPLMSKMPEEEKNNKYYNFAGSYNRVYVHHRLGYPYSRYCLTEGPTAPQDPDGFAFEHGGGTYLKVANNRIDYTANPENTLGGQSVTNDLSLPWFVRYSPTTQYNVLNENELPPTLVLGGMACNYGSRVMFKNTKPDAPTVKCIFETEMYVDISNLEWVKSDESSFWFLSVHFLKSDGTTSNWLNAKGEADNLVRLCAYKDDEGERAYWYKGESSNINIPLKTWFSFRVEQIGQKIYILCNGMRAVTITAPEITDFGWVKIEPRVKSYATGATVLLANTCVHSNSERVPSEATLDSIPQRTNRGFLRVPVFTVDSEPTEEEATDIGQSTSYLDQIAVPFKYVFSLKEKLEAKIANHTHDFSGYVKTNVLTETLKGYQPKGNYSLSGHTHEEYALKSEISNSGGNITVDTELSETSKNPVENAVVAAALKVMQNNIDSINECGCVVDSELSDGSTNPVQNTVINMEFENVYDELYRIETGNSGVYKAQKADHATTAGFLKGSITSGTSVTGNKVDVTFLNGRLILLVWGGRLGSEYVRRSDFLYVSDRTKRNYSMSGAWQYQNDVLTFAPNDEPSVQLMTVDWIASYLIGSLELNMDQI